MKQEICHAPLSESHRRRILAWEDESTIFWQFPGKGRSYSENNPIFELIESKIMSDMLVLN